MDELTDLGVVDAAAALARRDVSAVELTEACLARIREVDGEHSHDGDAGSINAWVRVYADDALAAAAQADELLAAGGDLPPLLGVPIGLKDLYEVAGKPVTASSSLLADVPTEDCDVWRRLKAAGMVLLGHLHTHEFAAGGRDRYRPALREWLELGESRAISGERYAGSQARRRQMTAEWANWLDEQHITALIEPTIPTVAPLRGDGYRHAGSDIALISLTQFWNWTGFPVAALPAGVGPTSGLPVSVSLIGPAASDWELLALGIQLQRELGVSEFPTLNGA